MSDPIFRGRKSEGVDSSLVWPRVTIVTPTFNRVEFLEDCIQSVLSQDYPNLEYIICDGGSSHQPVLDLIKKYEHRLAWWDSKPDRGHAEAIRRGFDQSSGQILNWLCSDDYLLPGALRTIGLAFAQDTGAEVIFGHSLQVDRLGRTLKENRAIPYWEWAAFTAGCIHQPAMFWTRSVYDRIGRNVGGKNWENVVYEPNVDLLCRLQKAKAHFVRVPAFLTAMRSHSGTVGATAGPELARVSRETLRRYYPICGTRPVYHALYFAMRFYQVGALIAQGDGRFMVRQTINWIRSRAGRAYGAISR